MSQSDDTNFVLQYANSPSVVNFSCSFYHDFDGMPNPTVLRIHLQQLLVVITNVSRISISPTDVFSHQDPGSLDRTLVTPTLTVSALRCISNPHCGSDPLLIFVSSEAFGWLLSEDGD